MLPSCHHQAGGGVKTSVTLVGQDIGNTFAAVSLGLRLLPLRFSLGRGRAAGFPSSLLRNKRPKSLQINDPVVTSFFHFQPAEGGLVAVVHLVSNPLLTPARLPALQKQAQL